MVLFICGIVMIAVGIIMMILMKKSIKTYNEQRKDEYGFTPKRLNKSYIIPIAVGAVIFFLSFFTSVPTGHTGVPVAFGKVSDYVLDAGIHVKLPWQTIIKMDNRVQKESAELSCFSSDIQEVAMLYTINFQIRQSDAMTIYSTIGKDYYEKVIVPCITESVKAVTAKYTAENLIGDRTELAMRIEEDLAKKLDGYNIILVSTSIEDMDFTEEFTNAVEAKQVAQQNKLKSETEADQKRIVAQGDADALLIAADAEANAYKKINESLTGSVLEKMYYDKWDGVLPGVVGTDSVVVMPNQNK